MGILEDCQTFRDPEQPMHLRVDAAKSIIPYIYPKLSSTDANSRDGQPLVVQILRFAPKADERQLPPAGPPLIEVAADAVTDAMVSVAATADDDEDDAT